MKSILRILIIAFVGLIWAQELYAYKTVGVKSTKVIKSSAASCAAGAAFTDLWVNNVRCRINTGGDMWWDLQGVAKYFIPGNSPKTSMFSAALWIGGLDVNGQLKLAAQRYRNNGNDYWPGPLTTDGNASVDASVCTQYDKHFIMTKAEVELFRRDPAGNLTQAIKDWPGNGDVSKKQSPYLAPFFDYDGDGIYAPEAGDYPYYDFSNALCKANVPTPETEAGIVKGGILADQVLKGDKTIWWVFNDKGNIHSETQGSPIGFEIRAQAFGFSTNDEINSMTFYSYEIINRSTYRLTETYFSQWVDTDLGYAWDDYVGCDVKRGLGYCYNGYDVDGSGKEDEYGPQPPAVGVDFFQGPYMDADGIDNPRYNNDGSIICDVGINGVNFGDSIVDNERYGMRRFVYHVNCASGPTCDPDDAPGYYNFLRGIWGDGVRMVYGGNGHPTSTGATNVVCDFMFPELSDPCNWGTAGIAPPGYKTGAGGAGTIWTDANAGNKPDDRRFMHSCGPFTLEPGAVNYITVGVPWARATSGGAWESVELLKVVDDKCQQLFDNCFKVLEGPDHPDLIAQELDREVLLYIKNYTGSNNEHETYHEIDPSIITPDSLTLPDSVYVPARVRWDTVYRFEGYQIFQLASATSTDLTDLDQARQVAQCDIKNGVASLINYTYDQELEANVAKQMVKATDMGIQHSFRVTEDMFATGDKRLVNHKKYYYVCVAYGYNNYKTYSQDPNVLNGLKGQKKPYLIGRKQPTVQTVIPHIPDPEANGTVMHADYGDGPKITRIEGQGNGGMKLDWTQASIDALMSKTSPPYILENPEFENGRGPIDVKVIDPLNVKKGKYELKFIPRADNKIDSCKWMLINTLTSDTSWSDTSILISNEQLLLDIGLSIQIKQSLKPGRTPQDSIMEVNNGYLESSIAFADSSKIWLTGIVDVDVPGAWNWIRSGILDDAANAVNNDWSMGGTNGFPYDPNEDYEKCVGRTWAPYNLCAYRDQGVATPAYSRPSLTLNKMANLASVNVVLTSDKSKWTRCPVIEMSPDAQLSQGKVDRYDIRAGQSVDKDGNPAPVGSGASDDPNAPNFIAEKGMGWFPGYAINLETGERLNMAFSEDSWLVTANGRDMLFNPTDIDPNNYYSSPNYMDNLGNVIFGGKHFIYVFGHNENLEPGYPAYDCPAYDYGKWARETISKSTFDRIYGYANAMWVSMAMAVTNQKWLSNDCVIKLRVAKPYAKNYSVSTVGSSNPKNENFPMYTFTTEDIATETSNNSMAESALDLINVVPNPYYGFSGYETDQLDNRVKITNLPEECTISIYTVSGILVRKFTKSTETTDIDWDLKNSAGIPIAGGIYLIHVDAPGIGEKVVKWFGTLRPVDLNSF